MAAQKTPTEVVLEALAAQQCLLDATRDQRTVSIYVHPNDVKAVSLLIGAMQKEDRDSSITSTGTFKVKAARTASGRWTLKDQSLAWLRHGLDRVRVDRRARARTRKRAVCSYQYRFNSNWIQIQLNYRVLQRRVAVDVRLPMARTPHHE